MKLKGKRRDDQWGSKTIFVAVDPTMVENLVRFTCGITFRLKSRERLDFAKDIVQTALLEAYLHRATYNPEKGSFQNWLYTIVARTVRPMVTREDHMERQPLDQMEKEALGEDRKRLTSSFSPESEVAWKKVREHVCRLPDIYRGAIEMHEFQGLSHAEAALVVGCSEKAMKVRHHRAIQELRTLIEGGSKQ